MNNAEDTMRLLWKFLLAEVIGALIIVGVATTYLYLTRPSVPNDWPAELKTLSTSKYDNPRLLAYNSSGAIIYLSLHDAISSVKGYWYGENATLELKGTESSKVEGIPGITKRLWGTGIDIKYGNTTRSCLTDFNVVFPIKEESNHQMLTFTAKMDVAYPGLVDESTYETQYGSISREFNFFIISPEEMKLKNQIEDNSTMNSVLSTAGPVFWVFLVCPIAFVLYLIARNVRARGARAAFLGR